MKTILANTIEPLEKRQEKSYNYKEMIQRCGANTGNVCFVDALYQQLEYVKEIVCYDIDSDTEEDVVYVLPASNWINNDGRVLQQIFLRLKNTKVKVSVIGLGVQMKLHQRIDDFIRELSTETIAALKIMSDHSVCIGIRGGTTGEVLDRLSIHNWQVIGCPSFYEPYRKTKTIVLKKASVEKICYNTKAGLKNEHKLIAMALSTKAPIVYQAVGDLELTEEKLIKQGMMDFRYPRRNVKTWEIANYLQESGHIFYNREDWSQYLVKNNVTFSTGGRFHGNMMAFSNGIPATWIVHDERIREMVDAMKLSFVYYDDLEDMDTPDKMLDACNYDNEFVHHYEKMGEEYVKFLEKSNVQHTFDSAYSKEHI